MLRCSSVAVKWWGESSICSLRVRFIWGVPLSVRKIKDCVYRKVIWCFLCFFSLLFTGLLICYSPRDFADLSHSGDKTWIELSFRIKSDIFQSFCFHFSLFSPYAKLGTSSLSFFFPVSLMFLYKTYIFSIFPLSLLSPIPLQKITSSQSFCLPFSPLPL